MTEATMDTETQVQNDSCRVEPEAGQPDGSPNPTMSFERLSGFLQN
jgi:hypothetical protein